MQRIRLQRSALAWSSALLLGGLAHAQVVNPADKAASQDRARTGDLADELDADLQDGHAPSYAMPSIEVQGERVSPLREEDRIGSYGQPRWTAKRRFPSTRVYVVPEGKVEFEWWARWKDPRDGKPELQTQYEWEFGLPHRLQLDLYAVSNQTVDTGEMAFNEQKIELRYAFADWGKLWGNPAAYVEWDQKSDEADVVEYKLLLGDEAAVGWHWGANLIYEQQVGDLREAEYGLSLGLSHTLQDERLSLGGELKAALVDDSADRGDYAKELEIGPSLQWRPNPALHIDFAPLVGIGPDSRQFDVFVVIGWEF
ncbi:MAG: hypothetical protein IT453_14165 [Planctomycetes bacterium]|nr:hypothetical protein [Planctomycetota bacterium]